MPDLPTLEAPAAPDEEPHDREAVPPSDRPDCPNCGTRLRGRYCHGCGQIDQPLRMPVHRFLVQSFTEFLGIDGRVWKTLGVLLFKPGKLTEAYLQGQRRRYLRPLRVYLSSTLLFFFLLSVLDPVGQLRDVLVNAPSQSDSTITAGAYVADLDARIAEEEAETARQRVAVDSLRARLDSVRAAFRADSLAGRLIEPDSLDEARERVEDALDDVDDAQDRLGAMDGSMSDRRRAWQREQAARYPADSLIRPTDLTTAAEIVLRDSDDGPNIELGPLEGVFGRGRAYERLKTSRTTEDRIEAGVDLARTAINKVPVVLFLMLPVFALLLKVIYVRRGWYYSEHLVFGLHTHAFAFLVFSVIAGLAAFGTDQPWTAVGAIALYVAIPIYFLIAQRRVYQQGWMKTVFKSTILGWAYVLVLAVFGLTLTVLLAFLG